MSFPGVNINVESGNLLRAIAVLDGVGAFAATANTPSLIGTVQTVYSLQDAEQKGYTEAAEPFLHKLIAEFYAELGGNMRLFILGTAETETMADVVDANNTTGLKLLSQVSGGEVNLVAIARNPEAGYDAGADFLDADVEAAVLGSLPLCKALQGKNTPMRLFIEGRVVNENVPNAFSPKTANNGFVGVVLGGMAPDGSAAVSLALARTCRFGAHVKIGSGQNGALSAIEMYVGTNPILKRLDLEVLHDEGFITFMRRPGAAGYYFGVDNMSTQDDFRILVHGRVIDKAQRIAAAAYLPFVEDSIRLNPDGSINETDAKHLEDILTAAIRSNMGDQISGVSVVIDPAQDIINTSTLQVGCKILPLGYLTWITVNLGLTASIQA